MTLIALGGVSAYFDLRAYTRTTRLLVEKLERRIDDSKIEQIAVRVEAMWAFQLRRGIMELEHKGLGTIEPHE